jgi:hypothetical protein
LHIVIVCRKALWGTYKVFNNNNNNNNNNFVILAGTVSRVLSKIVAPNDFELASNSTIRISTQF